MLVIDGSHGEGGGQVLRTALALAVLANQPVRIERVRAGRKRPGLRPQHLTAARAAAVICGARLEGDRLGSETLAFAPSGPPRPGEYVFDVTDATQGGSAGSVGLVLQTVLMPLALAPGESRVILRGGTHVPWAPSASYLDTVFLPAVARMGVRARMNVVRWGFYPAGGGELEVRINGQSRPLRPIALLERGALLGIAGRAAAMNLPAHIPQRMAARATNVLAGAGLDARVEPQRLRGAGPGAGIFLSVDYAHTAAGFTSFGRQGLPSERVAEAACEELLAFHHSAAAVDSYLADQLILPMALAEGVSRVTTARVTSHLLTNVWVVQQFLPVQVSVKGEPGTLGTVVVDGRGS